LTTNRVSQSTIGRIEALTSLRYLAAFIVVCFHFGQQTWLVKSFPGIFWTGAEMVTMFFVLSGFVLTLAYRDKPSFSGEYYINRVARILPAYYLALALVVLPKLAHGLNDFDWTAFFLSATFLQSWIPPYPTSLNYPGWTLSVEVAFYVVFPFLLKSAMRMRLNHLLLLSGGLWLMTQVIEISIANSDWYRAHQANAFLLLFFSPPPFLCSFLMGIYGGRLMAAHPEGSEPGEFWSSVRTVAICLLTILVINERTEFSKWLGIYFPTQGSMMTPLYLLLILQLAFGHDRFARVLSWAPFVALGQASYSFYILQVPVHRMYLKTVSPFLPADENIQFWIFVVMLTGLAILSQKYIEMPSSRFIRRLLPKKSAPVAVPLTSPAVTNNIVT
jgi:peptidoglycan/LPS O-acetylase OafA/YrhL